MLGLIPNFLSLLRKKRCWCAFFSTASVWADHVRSSWELKAVYLFHRCLVDGDGCVFSALSPVINHQLLGLVDVEWEVVLLAPFSQGTHLLSVGRLIVVCDQAYHRCVVGKFDDDIGAVCCCTENTGVGWGRSPVEHQCWGSGEMRCCCPFWPPDFCLSGSRGSSCTEICSVPESGALQPVWVQVLLCIIMQVLLCISSKWYINALSR